MKRLLVLLAWLVPAAMLADEPAVGRTVFPGSLAPVPATARDLTRRQPVAAGEPVSFQIALRLQPDGGAPETEYTALKQWLREQGLTVTESEPALHSMVQVTGPVGRVSEALALRFGRVEIDGRAWVAAVSAPSLPTALGGSVIGINGLQPFAHLRKGPVPVRPLTSRPGPAALPAPSSAGS